MYKPPRGFKSLSLRHSEWVGDTECQPTSRSRTALFDLGAATLGESGARRDAGRASAPPGPARASPRRRSRCAARRATTSRSTSRSRARDDGRRARGRRRRLPRARLLGRGAHHRGAGPRDRRGSSSTVACATSRDPGARLPRLLVDDRAAAARRRAAPGAIGAPVHCGGVPVELGDWVVGDADGVVVVPGATLADVINAGRVRAAKEAEMFDALREGRTTVELLGPRPVTDRAGATCMKVLIGDGRIRARAAEAAAQRRRQLLGAGRTRSRCWPSSRAPRATMPVASRARPRRPRRWSGPRRRGARRRGARSTRSSRCCPRRGGRWSTRGSRPVTPVRCSCGWPSRRAST